MCMVKYVLIRTDARMCFIFNELSDKSLLTLFSRQCEVYQSDQQYNVHVWKV